MNPMENKHIEAPALNGKENIISLNKCQRMGLCLGVAALVCVSAFFAYSYLETRGRLQSSLAQLEEKEKETRILEQNIDMLQTENTEFSEDISELQSIAEEMTNRVTELDAIKQELSEQLEQFRTSDSSSAEVLSIMTNDLSGRIIGEDTKNISFTNVVTTSYFKTTALSTQFDRLDSMLNNTTLSFVSVASDVTQTAASFSDIPSGMPVQGLITTTFNPTGDPNISDGRVHYGIDISTYRQRIPLYATAAGIVIEEEFHPGYGYYVRIDHGNGYHTLYAHNSVNLVQVGDTVHKGDEIAIAGSTGQSTGVHCHYEIILNGIHQDPADYF